VAQRVGRGIALVVSSTPRLPPGKTRYPFYRRLGGHQGQSGLAENLVPTGIQSRTVQPIAQSLYRLSHPAHTDCMNFSNIIPTIISFFVSASNNCYMSYFAVLILIAVFYPSLRPASRHQHSKHVPGTAS